MTRWSLFALFSIAVISCAGLGTEANAHARLKTAKPAANAAVKTGLSTIELTFNEAVEPALSVVELDDANGKVVTSSKGTAICEKKVCRLDIPPLQAGSYTVRYHVLSEDGHTVEGSYGFKAAD